MFKADLFVMTPDLKQCKLCCVLTKKLSSAIKILIYTTRWMPLKAIMLSERRPPKSNTYCIISLT